MSKDGKKGMLKFITFEKTINKEREYVDTSIERSRTQQGAPTLISLAIPHLHPQRGKED